MERLQKLLARAGIASRRAGEQIILSGRVTIDGEVVAQLGVKADPAVQEIAVDGRPLVLPEATHALMLNKPAGVLSTREDDRGRPSVMDFVAEDLRRLVYPVGRLDKDSTGLILLLNDGALAFRLTHPSYHVPKTYCVLASRPLSAAETRLLSAGVELEDGMTAPARVEAEVGHPERLLIVLYEGRKRQIRRMLQAIGVQTILLQRIAMGPLQLGALPRGAVRELAFQELSALRRAVGLPE